MKSKNPLQLLLESLKDHQATLFDKGHDFWFCDAQDREHNKPFYYYQINRTEHMATCGTCQKLMELRREIRKVEKALNLPLTPLWTNYKGENLSKHVCCNNSSEYNPTYQYM